MIKPSTKPGTAQSVPYYECVLIGSAQSNVAEKATEKGMEWFLEGAKSTVKGTCHFVVKKVFTFYEGYHVYHCYESCQECPSGDCPEKKSEPLTDFDGPKPYIGNPNIKRRR